MPRSTLYAAVAAIALAASTVGLLIQVRSLRRELSDARTQGPPGPPPSDAVPAVVLQEERARTEQLGKRVAELEAKLAERPDPKKPEETAVKPVDPTPPKEDGASPSVKDVQAKLAKTIRIDQDLPEEAAKALGLDERQVAAVNLALKDELKRIDEQVRLFYAANVNPNEDGLADKSGKDLMFLMVGKMLPDLQGLQKLPLEEQLKVHSTSSLEELLGPDKFTSKVAREMHSIRMRTYEDLRRTLSPEQLAAFRETYLREGSFYYGDNLTYEFGLAPAEMRK